MLAIRGNALREPPRGRLSGGKNQSRWMSCEAIPAPTPGAVDPSDGITRETLVAQGGEVVNARFREMLGLPASWAPEATRSSSPSALGEQNVLAIRAQPLRNRLSREVRQCRGFISARS
jgi:hypothetical protein